MPQNFENLPPNWEDIKKDCEHISLACPWTISCKDGTLEFIITSLEWTFNHDFWIRVTVHSEGSPNTPKQFSIDKYHFLLESLSEALIDYVKLPEPHLNFLQLHILGELLDFLFWGNLISKMANAHLAYPDLALDKFSGTDPDQDAEAFVRLIECKINFALGTEPEAAADEHVIYLFRKKALFSSLLRGPAAEWYASTITDAMIWNDVRTLFITRVSDGRKKFRHRMEVEHCIRADGEEIRNFLHRIKKTVDKGWPDDMAGVLVADQAAERTAQARQRRQRYIDYTLKGLRPRYLQRKAQEYLMEHPNATWNDFSTHLINKDVSYQVSTSFLNDEEQNKAQMASLGQELKNLRTELKEHRINALEGNHRPVDPNQKGRQNATRFCGYCRTNGHTPNYCRKKMRDEEIKKLQNEATAEKKVTFTQDYNKKPGPSVVLGTGLDGTMMMRLWYQPHDHLLEEIFGQVIRILTTSDKIDILRKEITRITTMIDTMTTVRDHNISRTKVNLGIGEVTITIHGRLQRHDKIHPSRISVDNPDRIHLIIRCLIVSETKIRTKIHLTKKSSRPPTMGISQT